MSMKVNGRATISSGLPSAGTVRTGIDQQLTASNEGIAGSKEGIDQVIAPALVK
jgi:hypothetical protein